MGDKTGIGWTDATWTTVTGCARVSPGCGGPGEHGGCYAEVLSAGKLAKSPKYVGVAEKNTAGQPRWTGLIRTHPDAMDQPLRWRSPRRIFVNSMSDTFHEDVPNEFIAAIFGIMAATPQHSYQVLTKRAERLPQWFQWVGNHCGDEDPLHPSQVVQWFYWQAVQHSKRACDQPVVQWPLPNVAIGVSVENQKYADERIPFLLQTPAAVRWISAEPLLGSVDLSQWIGDGIRWLVVGGESGPRHRTMDLAWLESITRQCQNAGVPVFVKQDSGMRPGKQGRISDELWALKQYAGA